MLVPQPGRPCVLPTAEAVLYRSSRARIRWVARSRSGTSGRLGVMSDFPSFREFMKQLILPMQADHPEDTRLDGQPSGGNREVVARFSHGGRRWKVHADTHYRQLLVAYEALRDGEVRDPFVEGPTRHGISLD